MPSSTRQYLRPYERRVAGCPDHLVTTDEFPAARGHERVPALVVEVDHIFDNGLDGVLFVLGPGSGHAGSVSVADIGIPTGAPGRASPGLQPGGYCRRSRPAADTTQSSTDRAARLGRTPRGSHPVRSESPRPGGRRDRTPRQEGSRNGSAACFTTRIYGGNACRGHRTGPGMGTVRARPRLYGRSGV